ncbi:MAG: hypothetical protein GYB66_11030 [Chloroflexi bacterium]|nr:hypothetical protein [Chloroflexota bacterium]
MTASSSRLDRAILSTLLYGDVFGFPMSAAEIHHYLIGVSTTYNTVRNALNNPSQWLASHIVCDTREGEAYYKVRLQKEDIVAWRQQRRAASSTLWPKARRYGILLGHFPFVQMVAITGSLAMQNAQDPNDDLDYFLIVHPRRVWLARLFAVILVRITRLWGVTLCPNYVLAEDALEQDPQDLFMAHEISQMIPLVGHAVYEKMRAQNRWTEELLPNARSVFWPEPDVQPRGVGRVLQRFGEWILSGRIGNWLEAWEMRRKRRKFAEQHPEAKEVQLDEHRVKGHFTDYGHTTLLAYEQRLSALGMKPNEQTESDARAYTPALISQFQ